MQQTEIRLLRKAMIKRYKWLGFVSSLAVIPSVTLVNLTTGVKAAAPSRSHAAAPKASAKTSAVASRCKTRNTATGTIKWSDWQFPDTFSTYTGGNLAVSALNTNLIFDGLTLYDSTVKLIPDVLTTIPTVKNRGIQNGGKTIVLHVKKGIQWSNGAAITSKDINFAFKINSDPLTGPACSGTCDAIARIDTPDKYTAILHMKRVYAPTVPYALPGIEPMKWAGAWNNNAHQAAQKLMDASYNFENSSYPTDGPYQVYEFVKDDRIVYKPMKYYSILSCGPKVKTIIFAFYSDKNAMIAAAASRQTDLTQDYTVADLSQLNAHKSAYTVHSDPGFFVEHFEMNEDPTFQGKPNPLSHAKVRLAIALAFDKIGMIRNALGVSTAVAKSIVAWTPLVNTPTLRQPFADTKITGQWDPIAKKYRNDTGSPSAVADAKKLLAQTPYASGFTLRLFTTSGNPVRAAQLGVLASNLKKIGITASPNFVPASKFFGGWDQGGTLDHGDYQLADFAYTGLPDPDQLRANLESKYCDRRQTVHALVNQNESCIQSPSIDDDMKRAAGSLDSAVRQKYYNRMQVEINQKSYWIPLYSRPSISTVDNHLVNFKNNPTEIGLTWNTWAWAYKS
jgi:peptide/nickel transport system substrate-binding protein